MVGIPTGHMTPDTTVDQASFNLSFDQPITKGWHQQIGDHEADSV